MRTAFDQRVTQTIRPLVGQKMLLVVTSMLVLGATVVLFRQAVGSSSPMTMLSVSSTDDKQAAVRPYRMANLTTLASEFENCTVSKPTTPTEWSTKPLFLAGYPSSLEGKGDLAKPLIRLLTGLNGGAKNYHAANKRLKRCQGTDQTVTVRCIPLSAWDQNALRIYSLRLLF